MSMNCLNHHILYHKYIIALEKNMFKWMKWKIMREWGAIVLSTINRDLIDIVMLEQTLEGSEMKKHFRYLKSEPSRGREQRVKGPEPHIISMFKENQGGHFGWNKA